MDGDWTSPDLTAVIRLAVRNLTAVESGNSWFSALSRMADVLRHHRRANTVQGSRRNISEHYDLNNEFFRLFLDQRMVYSCAWYETPEDTLEIAQLQKLDRACRKLQLRPTDHLLEIGTGWGAMAIHAASHYGCRVTTTTISREQYEYAREQIAQAGLTDRIELLVEDYRHLKGRYDKLVNAYAAIQTVLFTAKLDPTKDAAADDHPEFACLQHWHRPSLRWHSLQCMHSGKRSVVDASRGRRRSVRNFRQFSVSLSILAALYQPE